MEQFELKERFSNQAHIALNPASKFPNCRNNEAWKLMKIISGSVKYKHYKSTNFVTQKKNYLRPDLSNFPSNWHTGFARYFSDNMSYEEIFQAHQTNLNIDRAFYKNINLELLNFVRFQKLGHHTTAFIYLYRMLEHSAYTAPMLFILSEKSFVKSYNEIASWFSGQKKTGELAFFKKFIESVFDDEMIQTNIDFQLSAPNDDIRKKHYKIIKQLSDGSSYSFNELNEDQSFSIPAKEISSLIITIRNRFFHYTISNSGNIKSEKLMDSDDFFGALNDTMMHWMATLFGQVIQKSTLSA